MIKKLIAYGAVSVCAVLAASQFGMAQEYLSGMKWQEPPVVTPGKTSADPPSDAIILLGNDLTAWENGDKWTVKDGVATIGQGDITTKQSFGDCQLHIEWSSPSPPKGHSQGRGNSGIFFQDRYEVQILDSYQDETYFDGQASAIYKQTPPMVNAMRPPGEWNTYDIVWNAPKFKDDGSLTSPAYVTVLHNGVLTLNHFALQGTTPFNQAPKYEKHGKLPIHLQDHGNPVRYRNIWVREIKPAVGKRVREPYFHNHATGKDTPVSAPVRGKITLDGKPLDNGKITWHANKDDETISANIQNGEFETDKLKSGEYIITIDRTDGDTKRNLPKKYSDKHQSGMRVEVGEGPNALELNFNLRSK